MSTETTAIVLSGFDEPKLAMDSQFAEAKAQALERARGIGAVESPMQQGFATEVLSGLNSMIRTIEKSRKDVKERPFELCKRIDAIARQASSDLELAARDISLKLGAYQKKLDDEAARLRRVEQERLAEIERQKQAEIARAAAAAAEEAKNKTAEEVRQAVTKATQAVVEAAQVATQNVLCQNLAATVPRKVEGQVVRRPWKYEVVDIRALYAARPDLVTLSEKASEINSLIRGDDGLREIPGLRIFQAVEVSTR